MAEFNQYDLASILSQMGTVSGAPNALAGASGVFQDLSKRQQATDRKASIQDQLNSLIGNASVPAVPFNPEASPLLPVDAQPATGLAATMGFNEQQVSNRKNLGAVSPEALLKQLVTSQTGSTKKHFRGFNPVTIISSDGKTKKIVMPRLNEISGRTELGDLDIPQGWKVTKETKSETRLGDLAFEGATINAKKKAVRNQVFIDKGVIAADSYANVARSVQLLKSIKTGGINAIKIISKQKFGIENGDEAELTNRLGQSVLAQLKPIFGAAFSEKEGGRLIAISAGLGKSTEGNIRILEQMMKIIKRASDRGRDAAWNSEDFETAQIIDDSLNFDLSIPGGVGISGQAPAEQTLQNLASPQQLPVGGAQLPPGFREIQ